MGQTFYCSDWFAADTILHGGRDKDERTVGNNRRLRRLNNGSIALRLHSTDIVTYHSDGTCTINMGGWDTVITKRAINDYSPARVYSAGGLKDLDGTPVYTAVWHDSDPLTPAKIQRCRKCHGTGEIVQLCTGGYWWGRNRDSNAVAALPGMTYTAQRRGWSWYPCDICNAPRNLPCENEEHERTHFSPEVRTYREAKSPRLCDHGFLEQHIDRFTCWRCDGEGMRDYGSRHLPTPFDTQLRIDSDGRVLGEEAEVREFLTYRGKLEEFYAYRAGIIEKLAKAN